jgi:hypothetical protein
MKKYYYQVVRTKQGNRYEFILQEFNLPNFEWNLGEDANFKCHRKDSILYAKQYEALDQDEARAYWFWQENQSGYSSKWEYCVYDFVA